MVKICSKCKEEKDISNFYYIKPRNTFEAQCRKCRNSLVVATRKKRYERHPELANYSKKWRLANKERYNHSQLLLRKRIRENVLRAYGGRNPSCKCCGESTFEFLALDHIDGNGNKDRKLHGTGTQLYSYLVKNNFPKIYQILCHNCNLAKGFYGECPHTLQ